MTEYQNQILDKLKSHHCILESNEDNTLLWEYLISEILKGKRRLLLISPKDLVNKLRDCFLDHYNERKNKDGKLPDFEEKRNIVFKDKNHSDIFFANETSTSAYSGDYDVVIVYNYDDFKHQKIHQTSIPLANSRKNGRFIATAKKLVKLPLSDLLGVGGCKIYSL